MILALAECLPGTPLAALLQLGLIDGVDCLMAAAARYKDSPGGLDKPEVMRGGPELLYGLLRR